MARLSIYVPSELAERLKQRPDINYSKLFQRMIKDRLDFDDKVEKEFGPFIKPKVK